MQKITALTGQIMKNFSTAACASICILALTPLFTTLPAAAAALQSPAQPGARCSFLPNAPDQHLVVKGDTLWDISGKFLKNPWCWPEVWGLNRDQIRDPHWIYPGQTIYFDRNAGRLRLGMPGGADGAGNGADGIGTVRLSPQIRMQAAERQAIAAIPADKIEPFLVRPLIIDEQQFKDAPVIMATAEGRVYLSRGDQAYVRGDLKGATIFQVYRPGAPLKDPVTLAVIAHEAAYLGIVQLERESRGADEAHRFMVTQTTQEMGLRDRLVPIMPAPIMNYVPHVPAQMTDARIVSIYGGGTQAGQNQVVTINVGSQQGLDVGSVLELQRLGPTVRDVTDGNKMVKLPNQEYGTLFVFRVFDKIAYGLVMQVNDVVQIGDIARSPE